MKKFSADEVLAMNVEQARRLLGVKGVRSLLKHWHPDINADPRARVVMAHLLSLRDRVGMSSSAAASVFSAKCLVGTRRVHQSTFEVDFALAPDLRDRFVENLRRIRFADKKMAAQMSLALPRKVKIVDTGSAPVVVVKRQGGIVLADWLDYGGRLSPEHVAWVGSGLLNIAAWGDWAGCALLGMGLDTVAIEPHAHQVMLPLGWEMVVWRGDRPSVISGRVASLFPMIETASLVPAAANLEMVRLTLRELCGDPFGQDLGGVLPENMKKWLTSGVSMSVVDAYVAWYAALEADFGKRRFVRWSHEGSPYA